MARTGKSNKAAKPRAFLHKKSERKNVAKNDKPTKEKKKKKKKKEEEEPKKKKKKKKKSIAKQDNSTSLVGPIRFPEQAKFYAAGAARSTNPGTPYNSNAFGSNRRTESNNNRWGSIAASTPIYNNNNNSYGNNNNSYGNNNNSYDQNRKRKRPKFQLKLPSATASVANREPMPWHGCVDEYYTSNQKGSAARSDFVLPTDFFAAPALAHLSQELESFASYVRLQPKEHDARQYVIQCITDLAGATYSASDVYIQCFGSYATPQVCTFLSDVDLALWGVVEAPTPVKTNHFAFHDYSDDGETEKMSASKADPKKGNKVQKWRDLLQEFADQQEKEEEALQDEVTETTVVATSKVVIDVDAEEETIVVAETKVRKTTKKALDFEMDTKGASDLGAPPPLFVLDRAGDSDDDDDGANKAVEEAEKIMDLTNDNDDSDDDSADKMENLKKNRPTHGAERILGPDDHYVEAVDSSDEEEEVRPAKMRKLADYLSSSSEEDNIATTSDGLEVSYHSSRRQAVAYTPPAVVGPVGKTRNLVVRALRSLGQGLRKNRIIDTVEVRHRARVPIVTMETRLGFEGDVAIGGHNGADTSAFAASCVEKYESFATVVLFLKIILNQQDLDKPFTGGLGSYKLYALVSHHLELHLSLGGKDEPGEVFASFLYRFGGNGSSLRSNKVSRECQSVLERDYPLECQDASIDLKPCHQLEYIIELFEISWTRLSKRLASKDKPSSFLVELVRHQSLNRQRNESLQCAGNLPKYAGSQDRRNINTSNTFSRLLQNNGRQGGNPNFARLQESSRRAADPRRGQQDRRNGPFPRFQNTTKPPPPPAVKKEPAPAIDADERDLLRGYGVKRDQNGVLIPRDGVERKQSRLEKLIGKVSKNRHSKKKQGRDKGLKAIAQNY